MAGTGRLLLLTTQSGTKRHKELAGDRQGVVCDLCSIYMNTKASSARPYRWALSFYLLSWIGLSVKWCSEVDSAASSTDALAYFFIPIWALIYALPFAVIGYLLGFIRRAAQSG